MTVLLKTNDWSMAYGVFQNANSNFELAQRQQPVDTTTPSLVTCCLDYGR